MYGWYWNSRVTLKSMYVRETMARTYGQFTDVIRLLVAIMMSLLFSVSFLVLGIDGTCTSHDVCTNLRNVVQYEGKQLQCAINM